MSFLLPSSQLPTTLPADGALVSTTVTLNCDTPDPRILASTSARNSSQVMAEQGRACSSRAVMAVFKAVQGFMGRPGCLANVLSLIAILSPSAPSA